MYLALSALLSLPLTSYQDYVREHQYALSTQSFAAWGSDAIKALLIAMMIASPLIALLYTAVRKVGERWWLWATGGAALTMLFMIMLAPVLIAPLFNDRSEEHTSELQSLMRISYAVFCLKKKNNKI